MTTEKKAMDDKTIEALKASIEHWRENANADNADDFKIGAKHCALCQRFALSVPLGKSCHGCPVMERTGRDGCKGTPYDQAPDAWSDWQDNPRDTKARAAAHIVSLRELHFLQSILIEELEFRVAQAKSLNVPFSQQAKNAMEYVAGEFAAGSVPAEGDWKVALGNENFIVLKRLKRER